MNNLSVEKSTKGKSHRHGKKVFVNAMMVRLLDFDY